MINKLINSLINKEITVVNKDIEILELKKSDGLKIIDSSIDFHCFPSMIERVLEKIDKKYNLTSNDIRNYIWKYDSSINYRSLIKEEEVEKEVKIWKEIIKPKCDTYRKFIKKNLNYI
jgi:hypothetical protein